MFDLECVDVTKRFGPLTAVAGVSLNVPRGSFFSILGPSGCGKTTLMRMIAGFEEPTSGDIRLKGQSVVNTPPNKRNVKMVFQHLALFPMMTVGENIAYGLRCRGESRAECERKVKAVLARVGLPDAADKQVTQLSGGQKQRVAIARCMVLEPDVLLLDEPLGALDLKLREHMKIELKLLQHQFETTFLYITHDQSEALVMSDQVAVMNAGRFEQVGTPQELYHRPTSGFVAGFVGDSNRWPGRAGERRGEHQLVELADGTRIIARAGEAVSPGDEVEVFVRPESLRLAGDDGGEERNRIAGTLENLLFNGANSRLLVNTAVGLIEVDGRAAADGLSAPETGSRVAIDWLPERTWCFRRKGAA